MTRAFFARALMRIPNLTLEVSCLPLYLNPFQNRPSPCRYPFAALLPLFRRLPLPAGNSIVDYSLLFTNTLLDYIEASGDQETGHDLYAIAEKQFHLALRRVGEDFIYEVPVPKDLLGGGEWHFIDCKLI